MFGGDRLGQPEQGRLQGQQLADEFDHPILLFKTNRRPGLAKNNSELAPDMIYGDKTKQQILELAPTFDWWNNGDFTANSIAWHLDNMRQLFAITSWGELAEVAQQWLSRFAENSGGNFYSSQLNEKVKYHPNTLHFINGVKNILHDVLRTPYKNGKTAADFIRENVQGQIMRDLHLPKFNTLFDSTNGLGILTHDVWSLDVELIDEQISNNGYSGHLLISIVDHFGLDEGDVNQAEGKGFHYLAGFRSWYMLQHYQGFAYRPFMTKIYLTIPIEGNLSEK